MGLVIRDSEINKSTKLRRILVHFQGALNVAYCLYVAFGATQKMDQKTR